MNTKVLLLSLAALAGAAIFFATQTQTDAGASVSEGLTRFGEFQRSFGKAYSSPQEMEYRLGVFLANSELIATHNADTSATYTLEVNQFADLTFDEFAAKFLGLEGDLNAARCERTADSLVNFNDESEVDWTKAGVVHPVKNQAACGSCWAFSAVAALESAFAIFKGQKGLCLSEQELVSCSGSYGNNGCGGGLMHYAYDYILDKGLNDGASYPYTARNDRCNAEKSGKGPYHLKGCKAIARGVENIIPVVRQQPAAVAFHVQNDFRFYKNGVYNPAGCRSPPNHAVLATGFKLDAALPYFRIKNSWGTAWGNQGYFDMSIGKGSGTCSLGAHAWNYIPTL